MCAVVRRARGARRARRSSQHPAVLGAINPALRGRASSPTTRWSRSWRSARSCSPSPAPRRCTPTWATSARSPIRRAWLFFVHARRWCSTTSARARCCSTDPAAIKNPFYLLAPQWALIPLVVLATCAAVIASQAVISGAFSLDARGDPDGLLPAPADPAHVRARRSARSTCRSSTGRCSSRWCCSSSASGSSDNLGGAYGIAVTLAMLIDSILIFVVMRRLWNWPLRLARRHRAAARRSSTSRSSRRTRSRFPTAAGSRC